MPRIYRAEGLYAGPPRVFIATAAYSFHPNYTHSLARAMPALYAAGITADLCHVADDCHVDDARNAMVRQFLMSKADALIFIDNDVGFDPQDLVRLATLDRDIVAGIYPCKEDDESFPIRVADGVALQAEADGCVEVLGLPTGFMKIKRHVLERMTAAEPRKFYGRGMSHDEPPLTILFERTYADGARFSGDYAFCEKWRAMGGKLYAYPEMRFTHSGTKEWTGTLADYWKRKHGVYQAQFDSAVAHLKAGGDLTAEVLDSLCIGWRNDWAAQPELLVALWHSAKRATGPILETGSGLSTLVAALANPAVEVHSLEHSAVWAQRVERLGLPNVRLLLRPLESHEAGRFYGTQGLADRYSVVLLDGPPRLEGNRAIVFDALAKQLESADVVLMDDADTPTYVAELEAWAGEGRKVTVLGADRMFAIATRTK